MGQVVTVMNMKGGVGKTTVCLHIGGLLGRIRTRGQYHKVLLIDYDPQFNLSQAMLRSKSYFELERNNKTCLQILQESGLDLDPFAIQTPQSASPPAVKNLVVSVIKNRLGAQTDLIPSTLSLMYIALGTATGDLTVLEARFRSFIKEAKDEYDLVMIDCHPAGSLLTKTSLQNSDHILIPVAPQAYAARGVALMMRFIQSIQITGSGPRAHILFNLIPRTGPTPMIEQEIRNDLQYGPLCLDRTMTKYKAFSEPNEGQGFVWASGKPYSSEAYFVLRNLAIEFANRIEL